MRIVWFILAIVIVLMGIMNGGEIDAFIDLPSFLIVIGTTLGAFLMTAGPETGAVLGAVFSKTPSKNHIQSGLKAFKTARYGAVVGGVLSGVVGIVSLLQNLGKPETYGPGIAMILLGAFWGLALGYLVLLPIQSIIERSAETKNIPSEISLDLTILTLWGFLIPLVFCWILSSIS